MLPLTEKTIRTSFANASLRERTNLTLPSGFDALDWEQLDYLGWRDTKFPLLGYVFVHLDDEPVGILLRQSDGMLRSRPQCAWCEDVQLPNDVVYFNAKRAGQAGRNGNTVSTLICSNFECSANVRRRPPMAYVGFDVDAARLRRIESLREHVTRFAEEMRADR